MTYGHLGHIRVLDLGIVTAGASTSALLADLGAEVIKIEGPDYTDPFREWVGAAKGAAWWNESPQFQATNRNKHGVCVDLKSDAGRELFMRLVEQSDIVLENFRVGVMARLRLSFEELRERNPRIILVSISSQGQTGPKARNVSFGSTLESSSGMAAMMAYEPDGMPHITGRGLNYPDQVVSLFGAGAVIAALEEREKTGAGAFLDLSQREVSAFLIGEVIMAAEDEAPAGVLDAIPMPLEGLFKGSDGQWIAVTVERLRHEAASAVIGHRISAVSLGEWILHQPASQAARNLRDAGIAAEVVVKARGFSDDDAMRSVQALARDSLGRQVKGLPMRFGEHDVQTYRAAVSLGAQNEHVARRVAGLSAGEYEQLLRDRILGDRPLSEMD